LNSIARWLPREPVDSKGDILVGFELAPEEFVALVDRKLFDSSLALVLRRPDLVNIPNA